MTWPRSSTPRAPPAGPRAASSPTATCSPTCATPSPSRRGVPGRCGRGRLDPAVPAAGALVRAHHPDRLPGVRRGARALARRQHPDRGPAGVPAHVPARGAAGVREGLQRRAAAGRRQPGQEPDLPGRGGHGHRLEPGPGRRQRPGGSRRRGAQPAAAPRLFDRLVYARLRAAVGGRVQYAVSGGAPLGDRLGHFFRGAGMHRAGGLRAHRDLGRRLRSTRPTRNRIGTVGQPLPGISVRIAEDGEILMHGPQVFPRLLAATRPRPPRCSTTRAGCTPATSASWTTPGSCG